MRKMEMTLLKPSPSQTVQGDPLCTKVDAQDVVQDSFWRMQSQKIAVINGQVETTRELPNTELNDFVYLWVLLPHGQPR